MNRFFKKSFLTRAISAKIILLMLSMFIFLHLGMMLYYFHENRMTRQAAHRDELIQKIINAIYLVEATPIVSRKHAVRAMADPELHASFTAKPLWNMQFTKISFWNISHALRNNIDSFALSIRLDKNQWLNLNASIYSHVFSKQLLLIGIETLVFGAILLAVWSVLRFTEPLKQFKSSIQRFGLDLHSKPIDIYGPFAVREVAKAMNEMQQRIQNLINNRTQMLAAISHDLRTPITRMKIRSQFIEDQNLHDNFIGDLDEMENMISETLSFAREDSPKGKKVNIDLVSLIKSICDDARDMGYHVKFDTRTHRVPFLGRRMALKRAFTNVINNAIRFAKHVHVSLRIRNKIIIIRIDDDGPGIHQADLEKVFEPYYRGEQSRSRNTGGTGLGLAVTRDIINAHYGKIRLQNLKQGGLRVVIELPQG